MDYNEIGIQAIQNKDLEKAAEAFSKAIDADPTNAVAYINFGNLLASMNDEERAERFFQKAITLDEKAATAYYGLAGLYFNKERYEESAKLYEKALNYGISGADAPFMLGKSFERLGQSKLALPYLQRAKELDPNDVQIRLSYAICLASLELFTEAEPELVELLSLDPENADAHYNLGVLYAVSTGRKTDALFHLKKAFTIQPDYDQARYVHDMIAMNNQ